MVSNRVKVAPKEPLAEGTCRHYWIVGSPKGPTSRGVCKLCSAQKEFDVQTYFRDVAYDKMDWSDIGWLDFDKVAYEPQPGSSEPMPPTHQTFWRVSERGIGTQTMEWETEVGNHSIVLMNDDGSAGLDLVAVFKVKVPEALLWIGVGILVGGIIVLAIGGLMVFFAVRRPRAVSENGTQSKA